MNIWDKCSIHGQYLSFGTDPCPACELLPDEWFGMSLSARRHLLRPDLSGYRDRHLYLQSDLWGRDLSLLCLDCSLPLMSPVHWDSYEEAKGAQS